WDVSRGTSANSKAAPDLAMLRQRQRDRRLPLDQSLARPTNFLVLVATEPQIKTAKPFQAFNNLRNQRCQPSNGARCRRIEPPVLSALYLLLREFAKSLGTDLYQIHFTRASHLF